MELKLGYLDAPLSLRMTTTAVEESNKREEGSSMGRRIQGILYVFLVASPVPLAHGPVSYGTSNFDLCLYGSMNLVPSPITSCKGSVCVRNSRRRAIRLQERLSIDRVSPKTIESFHETCSCLATWVGWAVMDVEQ